MAEEMRFGKHAGIAMAGRRIKAELILLTLKKPEMRFFDISTGHTVAVRRIGDKSLIVVYDIVGKTYEVVTVFATSKTEKIIKRKVEIGYWTRL